MAKIASEQSPAGARSPRHDEVDRNFEVFQQHLSEWLPEHEGEFALLRHGQIVRFFASRSDARSHAEATYQDGMFSIQRVDSEPVDLGIFSRL